MKDPKEKNPNQKPDPTKDPDFKKVVKHFLNTPPKPHAKDKKIKGKDKQENRSS